MNKHKFIRVAFMVIAMLMVASCVTATRPAPAPTTSVPAVIEPTPVAKPATVTEDDNWAKIVAAAKKEGAITIYSTAFVADVGRHISTEFQKEYGIRVDILAGNGSILLQKILVEQSMKAQIGDVFNIGGAGSTSDLIIRGGADKIADVLPVLRDKSVFKVDPVYSPGGEGIVWVLAYSGVNVNTNLVKPEDEPKSYMDLLNPRWKGKIVSADPATTGGSTSFYYILRFNKVVDLDFYRQMAKQDMAIWRGNPREGAMMVARGEYFMEIGNSTDTVGPIMGAGAPLKTLSLKEGVGGYLGNIVIPKGAPHPNAARVFVNWLLSVQGQQVYAKIANSTPVRKDVPDYIHPRAQLDNPKVIPQTWEMQEWAVKDMAAKTMEQIFGR